MKHDSNTQREPIPTLVVSETETSTWHYHIRKVGPSGLKEGGGLRLLGDEGKALCGATLGWDTRIPLTGFGFPDRFSHWCEECILKSGLLIDLRW